MFLCRFTLSGAIGRALLHRSRHASPLLNSASIFSVLFQRYEAGACFLLRSTQSAFVSVNSVQMRLSTTIGLSRSFRCINCNKNCITRKQPHCRGLRLVAVSCRASCDVFIGAQKLWCGMVCDRWWVNYWCVRPRSAASASDAWNIILWFMIKLLCVITRLSTEPCYVVWISDIIFSCLVFAFTNAIVV